LKGGEDLTVENQSSIRFSVEESIWFQKGQEVSELLSMSLDPEITIQEHDQYISVRGGLVLTGEYHAQSKDEGADENSSLSPGVRTVQEVSVREDGVTLLKHKFPVDITIPKNRIQNLDDVYVSIESFDYELPQRGNLLLEAELSITGIYGDQEEAKPLTDLEDRDEEQVQEAEVSPQLSVLTESADEAQNEVTSEVEREEELVQPLMRGSYYEDEDQEVEEDDNPFTPFVVEAKREPAAESEAEELYDFEEDVEEVEEVAVSEETNVEVEQEEPYVFTRQTPQFEFKSRVEEAANNQDHTQSEEDGTSGRDENTLSLTKIFAKEEAAETTKLRMCIVQKDESIESIAERYDVSTQALIRVNNLDREHLAAGQILYIPVPVGSGK
jgi:stage VI sporulation protein D